MEKLSAVYADFICGMTYDQLPEEVMAQVKQRILDLVGVSLAGYQMTEFPKLMIGYLTGLGGTPEATILQTKKKFPAIHAAMANAACAHALDMDDGHRFGALHSGTVVIPAAMAATELSGAGTKEFITGVVVGYEVMIRVGKAIHPSSLNRGFHITGITGPLGAAAAAANIMKMSCEATIGALGLAGLQGAGLIQVNHEVEGSKVKPINPAKAAMSGLFSAILARRGARGPVEIFEGEDGFLKAFTDEVKNDLLTQGLGQEFEISQTYLKLYAACRHAHAAIDAALEAFQRSQLDPEAIQQILIETYPAAIRLAGIPHATTPSAGRFSIPFSVALALIKKDAGADKYTDETIRDERIQNLSQKVELRVGGRWEKEYPQKRGATVYIIDKKSRKWSSEVELAKGEPENPAGWEEIYKKFYTNGTLLLSDKEARKLAKVIMNLEQLSMDELMAHL